MKSKWNKNFLLSLSLENLVVHTVQHQFDLNDNVQDIFFFDNFYNMYKDEL